MIVTSDLLRGNTETIILSLLEQGDSYGYEINKGISKLSEGNYELKEATLYCAFRRMEEAGYISSYWGNEERGARRRYYRKDWIAARDLLDRIILKGAIDNGRT